MQYNYKSQAFNDIFRLGWYEKIDKSRIHFDEKYLENNLSKIGSQIAEANDLQAQSQKLQQKSIGILNAAQNELSDLYVLLDKILPGLRQVADEIDIKQPEQKE